MSGDLKSWSFERDLDDVLESTRDIWEALSGARIFITGGTGFIGRWMLESLRHVNDRLSLGIHATVLTRNPDGFRKKAPHLANYEGFTLVVGDVCNFAIPEGEFTHLIHAATDASADLNENDPLKMFDTVLLGTQRALGFAVEKRISKILYLSSGAVYGQQPWEMERVPETWTGAPSCVDARAAYAEGKRAAEMLCAIHQKQFGLNISIARIFALLGPFLSLDTHFAAGNFIRDAMHGKRIVIKGNGLPCRSYLYASDLTVWLWHLLVRGSGAYNVGSDHGVSVKELAATVSETLGGAGFDVLGAQDKGWNLGRYVPDTALIGKDLGLHRRVQLDEAIRRTAIWNGWKSKQ